MISYSLHFTLNASPLQTETRPLLLGCKKGGVSLACCVGWCTQGSATSYSLLFTLHSSLFGFGEGGDPPHMRLGPGPSGLAGLITDLRPIS